MRMRLLSPLAARAARLLPRCVSRPSCAATLATTLATTTGGPLARPRTGFAATTPAARTKSLDRAPPPPHPAAGVVVPPAPRRDGIPAQRLGEEQARLFTPPRRRREPPRRRRHEARRAALRRWRERAQRQTVRVDDQ